MYDIQYLDDLSAKLSKTLPRLNHPYPVDFCEEWKRVKWFPCAAGSKVCFTDRLLEYDFKVDTMDAMEESFDVGSRMIQYALDNPHILPNKVRQGMQVMTEYAEQASASTAPYFSADEQHYWYEFWKLWKVQLDLDRLMAPPALGISDPDRRNFFST
jgi:hypothetical protein